MFPAASEAGVFIPAIISGEFQGRIPATTPSGSRRVYCNWSSPAGSTAPLNSPATPPKYRNRLTSVCDSGRAWVRSAFPVSAAVNNANSSACSSSASAMRSNAFCRSLKCSARHAGKAALAAATARSASAGRPTGTRARMVPRRPGEGTSLHSPSSAATHCPLISMGRSGTVVAVAPGAVCVVVTWLPPGIVQQVADARRDDAHTIRQAETAAFDGTIPKVPPRVRSASTEP